MSIYALWSQWLCHSSSSNSCGVKKSACLRIVCLCMNRNLPWISSRARKYILRHILLWSRVKYYYDVKYVFGLWNRSMQQISVLKLVNDSQASCRNYYLNNYGLCIKFSSNFNSTTGKPRCSVCKRKVSRDYRNVVLDLSKRAIRNENNMIDQIYEK